MEQQQQQRVLESMAANDETLGHENGLQHGYQTFGNQEQPGSNNQQQQGDGARQRTGSHNHQSRSSSRPHVSEQPASTNSHRSGNVPRPGMTRVSSFYTPYMEDRLCRKLKFFFMGPHEKIKAKRKCPWKLLIQIFKILLVTIQVIFCLLLQSLTNLFQFQNNLS
jgi:hypothetical protein